MSKIEMASGPSAGERAGETIADYWFAELRKIPQLGAWARTARCAGGPIFLSATTAPLRMRLCRREYPALSER
jgi:hypothetical protein